MRSGGFRRESEWGGAGNNKKGRLPRPHRQLFQVHDGEFHRHPIRNAPESAKHRMTHPVLLFGIGEHPLYGLASHGVSRFSIRTVPYVLRDFEIFMPYMMRDRLLAKFAFRVMKKRKNRAYYLICTT
jgi:hypothetical protein